MILHLHRVRNVIMASYKDLRLQLNCGGWVLMIYLFKKNSFPAIVGKSFLYFSVQFFYYLLLIVAAKFDNLASLCWELWKIHAQLIFSRHRSQNTDATVVDSSRFFPIAIKQFCNNSNIIYCHSKPYYMSYQYFKHFAD